MFAFRSTDCRRKKKAFNSENGEVKKDSWQFVFYLLKREYGHSSEDVLDLSLREIDFKIRGFNESIIQEEKKPETSRTLDRKKVMNTINNRGNGNG